MLCGKASESLAHVLCGWSALARNRHIASFKVLFFEILTNLRLSDSVFPWYSRVDPKPFYEPPEAKVNWDVSVFAEHEHLAQNRVDIPYRKKKKKIALSLKTGDRFPLLMWVLN